MRGIQQNQPHMSMDYIGFGMFCKNSIWITKDLRFDSGERVNELNTSTKYNLKYKKG